MKSRDRSSKGCRDSPERPPGTSCPVPVPLVGTGGSGTFFVPLKNFYDLLGSSVRKNGLCLCCGLDSSKTGWTLGEGVGALNAVSLGSGVSKFPSLRVGSLSY